MSEDVDFGDVGDPTPTPTREAADLDAEEDFGSGGRDEQPEPTAIALAKQRLAAEMARVRFDKNFQLTILTILIISVGILLGYDFVISIYNGTSHFQTVLTVIMPVFTFLLGMGTQSREK